MIAAAPIFLPDEFNAATYFIDRHVAEGRGNKVAIECLDARITYSQLHERVNRVGNALRELKVRIEERVFLLLLDTPDFAACFFGAIKIGAVPVPINTLLKPPDYEYLLNNSRARVAIVSESLYSQIESVPKAQLRYLEHIVVLGANRHDAIHFEDWIHNASPELEPERTSKDDAAFWLYSSGSTGFPKACVHLQHDMVVAAERYAKGVLKITEDDRCFSVAKLFFAYGLGNGLYFALSVGATSILCPGPPKPAQVLEIIERQRPTLFFSVPSNYAALLNYEAEKQFDVSSVRYGISAGEALPAVIFQRFKQRFGIEILDAIGSTEVLHMFIANRPGAVRPGSSGQIIPGYDAKIVDENGVAVPTGELGNLMVRADSTCSQYWNQHERTKDTIEGQWIRTGDKYSQDTDEYFWYAGRSDDMLKCSGVWVSPVEIESVLVEHPAVREAAIIARRDKDELIKPQACVVLNDGVKGSAELAAALQEFIVSRLPIYKRPRWVDFFEELPKTTTGKLQRFKLRQQVAESKRDATEDPLPEHVEGPAVRTKK
jgi:benzoate-CoA ligase family protein